MKPNCINCRFADFSHHLSERGECRRFAPRSTIGQLDPDVHYGNPEMAGWPNVRRSDTCGEFMVDERAPMEALERIVREQIFGDGTAECQQRVIDLCITAEKRFGIQRVRS